MSFCKTLIPRKGVELTGINYSTQQMNKQSAVQDHICLCNHVSDVCRKTATDKTNRPPKQERKQTGNLIYRSLLINLSEF